MLTLQKIDHFANFKKILDYMEANTDVFDKAPGSRFKHHWWAGGYNDHVFDCIEIANTMWQSLTRFRKIHSFTLQEAHVVILLHDIEKPFLYHDGDLEKLGIVRAFRYETGLHSFTSKADRRRFRNFFIKHLCIELSDQQRNALLYVEGEHDYDPEVKQMGELAAFCHAVDTLSARLWFDKKAGDK